MLIAHDQHAEDALNRSVEVGTALLLNAPVERRLQVQPRRAPQQRWHAALYQPLVPERQDGTGAVEQARRRVVGHLDGITSDYQRWSIDEGGRNRRAVS